MPSLSYIRITIGSSSTFYFLLLILLSCVIELTLQYVNAPDLALTTIKYYEITSRQELTREEKSRQRDTEVSHLKSATDLSAKFGHESNAKLDDDLKKNAGMLVRITPRMINYWAIELKRIFQKELENKELPGFSRTLMKLNVSILMPRIHNIILPRFSYKIQSNNTMEVILHGGSAQLLSSYRAVYRTVREGHLEANLSSFVINLKLKIATTFAGKLLLEDIVCGAEILSIDIKLSPKLHELIDQGLRIELDEAVSVIICEGLEAFANKFEERLNKLIRSPIVEIKINDTVTHLLIDTTINSDISLTEDYFDFSLLGTPAVRKLESGTHLMKLPHDKVKMVYLYVSESVLNIFLKQLSTFGDTTLQLHADPDFQKMLRLKCSDSEQCMGDLLQDTEIYAPDSGRMVIKTRSPLVASVRNNFALIDLHLTSFITYKQDDMDVKVLEFEWLATIHVSNEYLNEHLAERDEPMQNTNASLQMVNLMISSITPYVELISNYGENLLRLISLRKKILEKLLTEQCSLTRTTSALYKPVSCTATFRNGTLVIATDLRWNPNIFYQFSLLS
ncbi:Lipopolysaccharide-binding protein [Dirofilaria immitis]